MDEVITTFERFVAAFNSGSRKAIEAAVSRYAQWYSVTLPSGHEVAYGQSGIVDHVLERHRAGDRLSIVRLRVPSLDAAWDGSTNVDPRLQLTRDGTTQPLLGKASLQCRGRGEGMVVLSLGSVP